jgi:hypothetical protein
MGIRFNCPNGHKLNVKEFLAGKRGVCPQCGAKFVIPMPTDVPLSEVPQPVGVGQSQSVEIDISPAPSHQTASTAASPSVIIPVTDMELAPPELELPPAIRGSEIPITDVLPVSIVAVQPPTVSGATGVTPEVAIPLQRERTRRNQIVISLLLLALVVLLAGVLVWVLKRDVKQTPVEKTTTAYRGASNQVLAMASGSLLISEHSRVGALEQ